MSHSRRDAVAEVRGVLARIRADVAHDKITAMGFAGSDRTTRRTVAQIKKAWWSGRASGEKWSENGRTLPAAHAGRTW